MPNRSDMFVADMLVLSMVLLVLFVLGGALSRFS